MAAIRSKVQPPVGSLEWISQEQHQTRQFIDQENEDFAFSARNEVDWLNEHMAEIFTKNQFNVTEIFKTPGKLRGKTPRTARKRDPLENRPPLTDIFSANTISVASPPRENNFYKQIATFKVAEDSTGEAQVQRFKDGKIYRAGKENTDSGYHGMSEDEMEIDYMTQGKPQSSPPKQEQLIIAPANVKTKTMALSLQRTSEGHRTTEGSFHSANEVVSEREPEEELLKEDETAANDDAMEIEDELELLAPINLKILDVDSQQPTSPAGMTLTVGSALSHNHTQFSASDNAPLSDGTRTPSDGSSPVRALVRKSSLTFASLPAREPLTTKKSIGGRVSRISHVEQSKMNMGGRESFLGRNTGGKSLGGARKMHPDSDNEEDDDAKDIGDDFEGTEHTERPDLLREESDGTKMTKMHYKTSTQRLHERINMLGQAHAAKPAQSTNTIPATLNQPTYPSLLRTETGEPAFIKEASEPPSMVVSSNKAPTNDEEEDDWIPPVTLKHDVRPNFTKSYSADVMEDISGKDSIGGAGLDLPPPERKSVSRAASPLRNQTVRDANTSPKSHRRSPSASAVLYPTMSTVMAPPSHRKILSVSNPTLSSFSKKPNQTQDSMTPIGSPVARKAMDGPLSASKAKLSSILKSAKGIFASSAGVSAQAKLETLSPPSMRPRNEAPARLLGGVMHDADPTKLNGGLYPDMQTVMEEVSQHEKTLNSPSKNGEGRKTRGSTERNEKKKLKEASEKQRVEDELEKARENERQKAAAYKLEREAHAPQVKQPVTHKDQIKAVKGEEPENSSRPSPRKAKQQEEYQILIHRAEIVDNDVQVAEVPQAVAAPEVARSQPPPSQLQRPREIRRPIRPTREVAPRAKPAPVAIRVGTDSQRELYNRKISHVQPSNSTTGASFHDSQAPAAGRPAGVSSKQGNGTLQHSNSTTSLKSSLSVASTKPKALVAAARKKEQDEKEAQRKLEQKREIERKRAAQQEEDRKQEQQQRRELERERERERSVIAEEPKKLAQKQAIEKRRLDMLRKAEQQKGPQVPPRIRSENDLAHAMQQEKSQIAPIPAPRGDLGGARPPPRMTSVQDYSMTVNQSQPNPVRPPKRGLQQDTMDEHAQHASNSRQGVVYQQTDSKRRKTNELESEEPEPRQAMAPPKRQSNMKKPNHAFPHGYAPAPHPSVVSHLPSKAIHPTELVTISNGRIPFANAPNPPVPTTKTPAHLQNNATTASSIVVTKSSPAYPNGDAISLPEIATDSEDEDSDTAFAPPSWANSPNLNVLLSNQQSVDAGSVFGPIAPLQMEEIFRNKERHGRFRNRTSSANWNQGDRLTEEECRRDLAARERMRRDGGWTFGL
ncbi:MAG: hypothetical protein M1827_005642 [Pycnora praestabilis]|nr:MAG: hypothetical protein M1827_005642 [Pycnora praestabilis]